MVCARFYLKSSEDMGELADGSVDLILTVPPEWDIVRRGEHHMIIKTQPRILVECYRVLKEGGFLLYNVGQRFFPPEMFMDIGTMFARIYYPYIAAYTIISFADFIPIADMVAVYVEKDRFMGKMEQKEKFRELYLPSCYEHILIFAKGKWKLKRIFPNIIPIPSSGFEMDEDLAKGLIEDFSEEGDIVLDPLAGTGTTGKVALQLGRNAVLYDIDPAMVKRVKEKIPSVQIFRKKEDLAV